MFIILLMLEKSLGCVQCNIWNPFEQFSKLSDNDGMDLYKNNPPFIMHWMRKTFPYILVF